MIGKAADVLSPKQPEPAPAVTDTELLNWIEREMQTQLGQGELWHIMHQVHRGVPLREAFMQSQAAATRHRSAFTVGDTVLLDGRWACEVLGFNWNYQEVLLRDPEGYHGWAVVTRLTLLREAGAP